MLSNENILSGVFIVGFVVAVNAIDKYRRKRKGK